MLIYTYKNIYFSNYQLNIHIYILTYDVLVHLRVKKKEHTHTLRREPWRHIRYKHIIIIIYFFRLVSVILHTDSAQFCKLIIINI